MKEYTFKLVVCALAVSLISSVCPKEYRKYVNGAGAILFLFVLLLPLRTLEGYNIDVLNEYYINRRDIFLSEETVHDIRVSIVSDDISARLNSAGFDCNVTAEIGERNGRMIFLYATVVLENEASDDELKNILEYVCGYTGLDKSDVSFIIPDSESEE